MEINGKIIRQICEMSEVDKLNILQEIFNSFSSTRTTVEGDNENGLFIKMDVMFIEEDEELFNEISEWAEENAEII